MRKNVHLIAQGKGGVGKTFIAWLMAQFLRERQGGEVGIFDTDPINQSLRAFEDLDVNYIRLFSNERNIEPGDFDRLMEAAVTSPGDLVIDTGSSNFVPLYTYLSYDQADQVFAAANCNLFIHVPIVGGESRADCLSRLEIMINHVPNARFVVWINNYPVAVFPKSDDPSLGEPGSFDNTDVFKSYRGRICGVVDLPQFPEDSTGKTLKFLTRNHLTFRQFDKIGASGSVEKVGGTAITLMSKFRAKQVKEALFSQFKILFDYFDRFHDDSTAVPIVDHPSESVQAGVFLPGEQKPGIQKPRAKAGAEG